VRKSCTTKKTTTTMKAVAVVVYMARRFMGPEAQMPPSLK
jgi:hypothetical protein